MSSNKEKMRIIKNYTRTDHPKLKYLHVNISDNLTYIYNTCNHRLLFFFSIAITPWQYCIKEPRTIHSLLDEQQIQSPNESDAHKSHPETERRLLS
uniref:Uncharacterized protein n=1 Tax=Oryza brachyantha TaxID=4533 RepID=J3MNR3_ORYBR